MPTLPASLSFLVEYIETGKEDHDVEFKKETNLRDEIQRREILQDICAIANSCDIDRYGYLVIGVRSEDARDYDPDQEAIPGFNLSRNEERSFIDLAKKMIIQHLHPRINVNTKFYDYNDVRIAVLTIIPMARPYSVVNYQGIKYKYWIRNDSSSIHANEELVIEFTRQEIEYNIMYTVIEELSENLERSPNEVFRDYTIEKINFLIVNKKRKDSHLYYLRAKLTITQANDLLPAAIKDITHAINIHPKAEYILFYCDIILEHSIKAAMSLGTDEDEIRELEKASIHINNIEKNMNNIFGLDESSMKYQEMAEKVAAAKTELNKRRLQLREILEINADEGQ